MMKALVTGGRGFLGGAIARALIAQGVEVRSLARGHDAKFESLGIEQVIGDIRDRETVLRAADGCGVVYHVAAKPGIWGSYRDYEAPNVDGTRHVIDACRHQGVSRLIFTSSPSVVYDGTDQEGVDESAPYPKTYQSHYPHTKAIAERMVLEANSSHLLTTAIRPHLIWGPGDTQLVPRVIRKAKADQLRRIEDPKRPKLVDSIYIDNAANAHLAASEHLHAPDQPPAGRAYFISQDDPMPLWDLIDKILAAAHLPPVRKRMSAGMAFAIGAGCEAFYSLTRRKDEPVMTRFLARQFATAHWFDISAAKRDFQYRPVISIDEGLKRLEAWLHRPDANGNPDANPDPDANRHC